jgi:hypothetical protein
MEETPPTRAVSFSHRSHRSHHHSTTHHHVSNSTPIGSQRRHQSMSNVTTPTSQGILGRLFSKYVVFRCVPNEIDWHIRLTGEVIQIQIDKNCIYLKL